MPRFVHFRGMTVVCAWCERTMTSGGTQPASGTRVHRMSYGICPGCLKETLTTLPPPPIVLAPQAAPLVAPG